MTLDLARSFPSVESINLGGGYKVARMPDEKPTDLQEVGSPVKELFKAFAEETGRELRLEIEPGTYLLAHGSLVTQVQDVTSTVKMGTVFLNSTQA